MSIKKKVKKILSNPTLFGIYVRLHNAWQPKNKLHAKGCNVTVGTALIKGLKIVNRGSDNTVAIGDGVRIRDCEIVIAGDHNTVYIHDGAMLNQVAIHMEDANNAITIGRRTNLCGKTLLAAIEGTKITIGEDCLFSSDLHFRTGDSHSILNSEGERINPSKDIVIEDHVWIGTKVTCLKGTRVAKNSIVAATGTLSREFTEENVVIGGVPGKVIKTGVNWTAKRL
ncbi:MAG: acyltransferase [Ruminococcaceae bacterium]|nr:acyltransferase [Oscillospiraceae bacterium]